MAADDTSKIPPIRSDRFLSMTLFRLPIEAVDSTVRRVLANIGQERMSRSVSPLNIYDIYEIEPPFGGAHLHRFVIYEPLISPNNTVMITNLRDGWNSLSGLLASDHMAIQAQVISTSLEADYPQQFFQTWANGRDDRTVMLMRDSDKWMFEERGTPKEFEQLESYAATPKKARLNRDMLVAYLKALGWDIESVDFWASGRDAIYYEQTGQKFLH